MIIFYDYEVFKFNWLVVFVNPITRTVTRINDVDALNKFYNENKQHIFAGYNTKHYDQWIFKGILAGHNPWDINNHIIRDGKHGAWYDRSLNYIQLYNYDVMFRKDRSLKQLEGFMGHDIKECSIDWTIERPLTPDEIEEVYKYCEHDVFETIQVFMNTKSNYNAHMNIINTFNRPLKDVTKSKAQLSAEILGAIPQERHDEWNIDIPDTLDIVKYKHIVDWYRRPHTYDDELIVDVAGVEHKFAWGGLHAARKNYVEEGFFVNSDVASQHPALIIEYGYLSRNVPSVDLYREMRDTRIKLKSAGNPQQEAYKLVLNATNGAAKDKYNKLYDPRMNNNVCIMAQLSLLDLIEQVEHLGELVQSNTDGILMKLHSEDDFDEYKRICTEWEKRTRLVLEHDIFKKVIQKDVNNYIVIEPDGSFKSKGAWLKKLTPLDQELPIVNEAIINYFIHDIPVRDTIYAPHKLVAFQQIVKVPSKDSLMYGVNVLREKVVRVFADKDRNKPSVHYLRNGKVSNVGSIPDNVFIDNSNVTEKRLPRRLDRDWYVRIAEDRIKKVTGIDDQIKFFKINLE